VCDCHLKILFYLGNCYDRLEKTTEAIEAYSKAIELDKDYIAAVYNRGNAFLKLGKEDLAYKDLSTAIELDANFYQAYYNRGTLLKRLGKSDQASVKALSKCVIAISKFSSFCAVCAKQKCASLLFGLALIAFEILSIAKSSLPCSWCKCPKLRCALALKFLSAAQYQGLFLYEHRADENNRKLLITLS
jgi:tetratricopeptide (TPR) repeat protein